MKSPKLFLPWVFSFYMANKYVIGIKQLNEGSVLHGVYVDATVDAILGKGRPRVGLELPFNYKQRIAQGGSSFFMEVAKRLQGESVEVVPTIDPIVNLYFDCALAIHDEVGMMHFEDVQSRHLRRLIDINRLNMQNHSSHDDPYRGHLSYHGRELKARLRLVKGIKANTHAVRLCDRMRKHVEQQAVDTARRERLEVLAVDSDHLKTLPEWLPEWTYEKIELGPGKFEEIFYGSFRK